MDGFQRAIVKISWKPASASVVVVVVFSQRVPPRRCWRCRVDSGLFFYTKIMLTHVGQRIALSAYSLQRDIMIETREVTLTCHDRTASFEL